MLVQISKFGKRLQGKTAGRKHYADICGQLAEVQLGKLVLLSFKGVESINGSWINTAIAPLFRWSAETQHDLFPVLSHVPQKDVDELELVAKVNQQCYPVSDDDREPIESVRLVGPLDEILFATLEKLSELGHATGAELARVVEVDPMRWTKYGVVFAMG